MIEFLDGLIFLQSDLIFTLVMVEFSKECMDADIFWFFLSDMVIDFKGGICVSA